MAQKLTYDPSLKLFIMNNGITSLDVVVDLYSDAKEDWLTNPLLNKFRFPLLAIGGQGIGGGQVVSPYIILRYGWKVRPYEGDHTLTVAGNLITDDETTPYATVLGDYQVTIKSIVTSNSLTSAANAVSLSQADINSIADGVWREILADHSGVSGSVAKTIKEIKTKATIASIK